jgi:hypothetical protein
MEKQEYFTMLVQLLEEVKRFTDSIKVLDNGEPECPAVLNLRNLTTLEACYDYVITKVSKN